jgi:mannitol 2-dehydrogenase
VASWARYCEGVDEEGQRIEVQDRRRDQVMALAARHREDPLAFIADRGLFGDLIDNERFVDASRSAQHSLHERGARGALLSLEGESES